MANLEQAAEAAGMSIDAFRALRPAARITFANRVAVGTHIQDTSKLDRIKAESEIAELQRRLAQLAAEPAAKFAHGRALQEHTREFIMDRIAGVRRRLTNQP